MNSILVFIGAIFILFVGRTIFIPLLIAVFLWYLINAIAAYYRKVLPFFKIDHEPAAKPKPVVKAAVKKQPVSRRVASKTKVAKPSLVVRAKPLICVACKTSNFIFDALSLLLSLATFGALVYAFVTQIQPAFAALITRLPELLERLFALQTYVADQFGMTINESILPDTSVLLTSIGSSVTQFSTALGLVLVYMLFMFIEQSTFPKKFSALFPEKSRSGKMRYILKSIDDNMKKYMFVKTFISALIAITSYVIMEYIGLEFAAVWAFILFILNYIPTFGTIIAVTLPILYSLITGVDTSQTIMVASGLIGVQIVFSNLIEPKMTGKALNLSILAILVNLVFWGILWGPVGMFFSVPLLVATFIIMSQFDSTRWIAVLLSASGEIPEKKGD